MAIVIPSLPEQTTTESADLFVLHNTASNRTKGITYSSLLSEISADIEPSFINPTELSAAQASTLSTANTYTDNKINNFIENAVNISSLANTDELAVKKTGGVTQSVTFSMLSSTIVANTQPNIDSAINGLNIGLTTAYQTADSNLLNDKLPLLSAKTVVDDFDYFPLYDNLNFSTKKVTYSILKNQLATQINAVTQAQLTSALAQVASDINNAKLAVLQQVFPVGSRISRIGANAFDNPSTYLGFGVWVREDGYFYAGYKEYNPLYPHFSTVGGTGGDVTHTHSGNTGAHTLTSAQVPSHSHGYKDRYMLEDTSQYAASLGGVEDSGYFNVGGTRGDTDNEVFFYLNKQTDPSGGGGSHSHSISIDAHLPPYKVEVCWRRTA